MPVFGLGFIDLCNDQPGLGYRARTKSWTLISLGISYRCFASFGPSLLIFAPSRTSEECADLVNRYLKLQHSLLVNHINFME